MQLPTSNLANGSAMRAAMKAGSKLWAPARPAVKQVISSELPRADIRVIHRESNGEAHSWDDVSGVELKFELAVKARKEEIEQCSKNGFTRK